jgi:predicted phosphodiesterase
LTLWSFVSDIHGNYAALSRAAAWCESAGVDRFVCLGDVIGKGDPEACVGWVRDNADIAIVGNRDLDYLDRVSPELQQVVRGWTNEARAADFIASHGDPAPTSRSTQLDGTSSTWGR